MSTSKNLSNLYITDFDSVKEFYELHFNTIFNLPESFLSAINNTISENLITQLKEYNQKIDADKNVLENIEKLRNNNCLTIITGQQPGLFTGPLYTIYKGLTAVKLAQHLSKIHKRDIVPIFWVVSEDHDFDEVNTIKWITKNNELNKFVFEPINYKKGLPIYEIESKGNLNELFDLMISTIYNTEYKEVILSDLINCLKSSQSFDEFFCRIMAMIFKGYGLVILPSHLKEIRKLATTIIQKEIENPLMSTNLVIKSSEMLHNKGLKTTLKRKGNEINFFFFQNNIRQKVTYDSNSFKIEGITKKFKKEELLQELSEYPEKFSPNVILRPIIQQFIFPNLVYVAGPGEISYHAQLKDVFKFFDVPSPILYPRKNFLIIEPSISQLINKYHIKIEKTLDSPKSLSKFIVYKSTPKKEMRLLDKSQKALLSILKDLEKELNYSGIEKAIDNINKFIIKGFEKIHNSLSNIYKDENDVITRHINKLNISLFPDGKPQERVLNIVQFLIKYGYQFIRILFNRIDLKETDVIILDIKSQLETSKKNK